MTKEQKFYKALQDVFIGAKIEGKGGFVNLMKIKSKYNKYNIVNNNVFSIKNCRSSGPLFLNPKNLRG